MKRKSKRKSGGKKKSSLRKRKSKKFDSGKTFSKLISTPEPVVELKYINTKCPFFKELWKLEGVIEYYTDMSVKDIIKICINNKKEYKNNIVPVAKQKLVEDVNVYIVMNEIVDYETEKEEIKNYLITLKDEK